MYVADDSNVSGIDYCFLVYNLNKQEWFLLCIQAKSAVYDMKNWTINKAKDRVSNVDKVLSNIENSFCVVLAINDNATYVWDEKEKEKGRDLVLMHERSIFAGQECVRQYFGPQYQHIYNWIVRCVTFTSHDHENGELFPSPNCIETKMELELKSDSNDGKDNDNSNTISNSNSNTNDSINNKTSNQKCCFICEKTKAPLGSLAMTSDD